MKKTQLAALTYFSVVEEIAEKQQRITLRRLLRQDHGDQTLPITKGARSYRDAMAQARDRLDREDERDRARLAELYPALQALEGSFAETNESAVERMAELMAGGMG